MGLFDIHTNRVALALLYKIYNYLVSLLGETSNRIMPMIRIYTRSRGVSSKRGLDYPCIEMQIVGDRSRLISDIVMHAVIAAIKTHSLDDANPMYEVSAEEVDGRNRIWIVDIIGDNYKISTQFCKYSGDIYRLSLMGIKKV